MGDRQADPGSSRSLVGRQRECATLDGLLDLVRSGRSAVLVVSGEAGIGKTALVRYLTDRAAGFTVARCVGVESEMELPFAGLHELCAPMLGGIDVLVEPQQRALGVALGLATGQRPDPFLVALATLSLLAETAEHAQLLCVVDDVQWLDQASAQVLGFVGRRLLAESIALVFVARTPVTARDHLAGLPELPLGGLDEQSARALLASVTDARVDEKVRARIIEEARGNPLALIELGAALGAADFAGGFAIPAAANLPLRIQDRYLTRLRGLPDEAQRLVLLAAADPVGDTALLGRAARTLGLGFGALDLAVDAGLLTIGAGVRFRHPLLRSAAYRAASIEDRRAVHGALAAATDPNVDPDRRAWHRAYAAAVPDEAVATELIGSADRAQRRGGAAAAAAFWERAVSLTPDAGVRALRALAAAEAKYAAGDFEVAQKMLGIAGIGPLDELGHAKVERIHAQIAFALNRGRDAPALLLRAAQGLQPLDADLASETFLEALVAAIYAGRLADASSLSDMATGALSAASGPEPLPHSHILLRGLAVRMTDGSAAAASMLKGALQQYLSEPLRLDWSCVAHTMVAMELWDDASWFELASGQAQLARASGTLSWLPFALDYLAEWHIQAGELAQADALMTEAARIDPGTRAATLPYVALLVAAWRGDAAGALELIETMVDGASSRGEGSALTYAEYARAVLYNGLCEHDLAADAAHRASSVDELAISPWALYELVEAAARSDQPERADAAADRLSAIAAAGGSDWALGAAARSRALLVDGDAAERLYREAIDLLSRTRMTTHLARARLSYGEWLRRKNRRVDARAQLRPAFQAFSGMGADAFGERARRELQATGEKVRRRSKDGSAELTPQEERIAQLARERRTNPEIGAELFLSARTVEWHLRNIFTKLDVGSRRELDAALTRRDRRATALRPTPGPLTARASDGGGKAEEMRRW